MDFIFSPKIKLCNGQGVVFIVKTHGDINAQWLTERCSEEDWRMAFDKLRDKVFRIVSEALGTDLPAVQPWEQRRRLDPLTFRRELAAFDKRKDEDAELWPGKTGKDLSNLKSHARTRFKKRLARLEQAAEERRRTLTTD